MKPEIRKIVTRSSLFFGILAVSAAEMKLAAWRNVQNAPDAVTASAAQDRILPQGLQMQKLRSERSEIEYCKSRK